MTASASPFAALPLSAALLGQLTFLREVDRLKAIVRQTLLVDGSRQETDAEHSWELALMAVVLRDHAPAGTDLMRILKMVLVHDLVEIDAGDAYAYDAGANAGQAAREATAARRIFGLLPDPMGAELRALWEEFEARETPDARTARALDRLQPLLHSYQTGGTMWRRHGVQPEAVHRGMAVVCEGMPALAPLVAAILDACEQGGFFPDPA